MVRLGKNILVLGQFRESDLCVRGPSEKVKVSMIWLSSQGTGESSESMNLHQEGGVG